MIVVAGVVVLGGTIAITQFASAEDNDTAACAETTNATTLRGGDGHRGHGNRPRRPQPPATTAPAEQPPAEQPPAEEPPAEQPPAEQPPAEQPPAEQPPAEEPPAEEPPAEQPPAEQPPAEDCDEDEGEQAPPAPPNNGLEILGNTCEGSDLEAHTGFQAGSRCVSTQFGEVGSAAQNPSLLIVQAPRTVRVGQAFTLQVNTRNLVRDRFLGAAAGGYYVESSFLNDEGLQRGHVHTACRMLTSTSEAPDPAPVPAFFRATEDGLGGGAPDTFTVEVATGMPSAGTAQCAVWAGDGSHRAPMMERANQTPPFDVVRIRVR
jgi:hypothetical protein